MAGHPIWLAVEISDAQLARPRDDTNTAALSVLGHMEHISVSRHELEEKFSFAVMCDFSLRLPPFFRYSSSISPIYGAIGRSPTSGLLNRFSRGFTVV